jgi:hypothetical protein
MNRAAGRGQRGPSGEHGGCFIDITDATAANQARAAASLALLASPVRGLKER